MRHSRDRKLASPTTNQGVNDSTDIQATNRPPHTAVRPITCGGVWVAMCYVGGCQYRHMYCSLCETDRSRGSERDNGVTFQEQSLQGLSYEPPCYVYASWLTLFITDTNQLEDATGCMHGRCFCSVLSNRTLSSARLPATAIQTWCCPKGRNRVRAMRSSCPAATGDHACMSAWGCT
jgi:hypothetical protein